MDPIGCVGNVTNSGFLVTVVVLDSLLETFSLDFIHSSFPVTKWMSVNTITMIITRIRMTRIKIDK